MADLPVYQNREQVEVPQMPEFEPSAEKLGESQNNLSAIGSRVTQAASNQIAVQLGQETGKNPKGDQLPPITEFDKNFNQAYTTQADATLTVQGQSLLDQASLAMSKANRLTPDLIASTNKNVSAGLAKIAENAPTAIKTQLQASFSSQMLQQNKEFSQKMIGQQKEDQINNTNNGLDVLGKNSYELSFNGDQKAAQAAVDRTKKIAASAVASRLISPEEARIRVETAEQNVLNGQYAALAKAHVQAGTYPQFADDFSRKDPKSLGMTNEQYQKTAAAIHEQAGFIETLQSQDQELKSMQMINRIVQDPTHIPGVDMQQLKQQIDPVRFEHVQYFYLEALKHAHDNNAAADYLKANWGSPTAQALAKPEQVNKSFVDQTQYAMRQTPGLSPEMAEVMVAKQAGGQIPAFTKEIKNKISSGNPQMIESAAIQLHLLKQLGAGRALSEFSPQDKAAVTMYEALRDSRDPVTAAKEMTDQIFNQDHDTQIANQQKWQALVSAGTKSVIAPSKFALHTFSMNEANFMNPGMAQVYGTHILSTYRSNYLLANGDNNVAKKLTQDYIDQNYGDTGINGGSFKTLHPIEKVLGYQNHDVVPFIQQDVINQLNDKFKASKAAFDAKTSNEYWETVPLNNKVHGLINKTYDPVQVNRYTRENGRLVKDTYNIALMGNAFNWDVALQTANGVRNIYQKAPYLGIANYTPNAEAIKTAYDAKHNLSSPGLMERTKSNIVIDAKKFKNYMTIPGGHELWR